MSLDWADPATYQYPQQRGITTKPSRLIDNNLDTDTLIETADRMDGVENIELSGASKEGGEWDVVLGADVVWLESLVPLLVGALDRLCGPHTQLFLAHQKRSEITDNLLFSSLSNFFTIEEVHCSLLSVDASYYNF